eukprot:768815-Hanusia_phi.AAC.5
MTPFVFVLVLVFLSLPYPAGGGIGVYGLWWGLAAGLGCTSWFSSLPIDFPAPAPSPSSLSLARRPL